MSAKKSLLAAAALTLAALGAALVLSFEAPGLGREVRDRIQAETGLACEAESSRFRLSGGLTLEGVTCASDVGIGGAEARLERAVLTHRLLPLLGGRLSLQRAALEEAKVTVALGQRSALEARSLHLAIASSAVRIEGKEVHAGDRFSIERVDLMLAELGYDRRALTPLHAITARGRMELRGSVLGAWSLGSLTSTLSAEGGRLRMESLRLESDRGILEGELDLDFNSIPFRYQTSLRGVISTANLTPGALHLEADGFGTAGENLRGSGTYELGRGSFPDAAWVRRIEPALVGREHAPAVIRFELRDGAVDLETFELHSPPYVVELGGSVALDGSTLPRFHLRRGDRSGVRRSAPKEARTQSTDHDD